MKFHRIIPALTASALAAALLLAPASAAAEPRFTDIEGHPAQEVIERYAALEIVSGVGGDQFQPDRTLTRAELAAILDRTFSYTVQSPNTFPDLAEGEWYCGPMLRLNAAGIVVGDGSGIRPKDTVRWDEALCMMARAFGVTDAPSDGYLPFPAEDWAWGQVAALYGMGCLPEGLWDLTAPFTRADTLVVLDKIVAVKGWNAAGKILFRNKLLPILDNVPVNRYDKNAFYRGTNGRLYYDDGVTPVAYGVDVSAYQKDINWWAVAADGIDFAILRVGGRGYGPEGKLYWDTYFEQNLAGAQAAGLDVGIYFFSQAITPQEAEEEAWQVLSHLQGRPLAYPIVFDWETISGAPARTDYLDSATLTACAQTFCSCIAVAGYQPMVYFNATNGLLDYDLSQLTGYPFWYAYYLPSTSTDPWLYYDFRMWQYTSSGSVAGIPGNADMNICFYPYGKAAGL